MFSKILIANRGKGRSLPVALAFVALTGAAQASSDPRFAIACEGTARFTETITGERIVRDYDLPTQIYVFHEAERRAQRALVPRLEFEDLCFRGGFIDNIGFSPGLIFVRSERAGEMCDFTVDRTTGEAHYFAHRDLPGGRYSQMAWRMTCSPAELPDFDRDRTRF